jgi:uncharacterized SAM-binding protein YcdF (DUF218 family)
MKHPTARQWRIFAVVVICAAVMLAFLAWIGAELLIVKKDLPSADAIVVLSGPGTYIERTDWAARLYREGRAPVVVLSNEGLLSGWSRAEQRNPYFHELAAAQLRQKGVPPANIKVISEIGAGTYQESLKICEYAAANNLKRLLVVTSAYHSRRALWSLDRTCSVKQIQIGMDSPGPGWQTPGPRFWWLHGSGWRMVAGEYVKLVYYRVNY